MKKKLFIISALLIIVALISTTAVLALNDYDTTTATSSYQFSAYVLPDIKTNVSGNSLTVSVTPLDGVEATSADLIVESDSDSLKINGATADITVTHGDSYVSVYKSVPLNASLSILGGTITSSHMICTSGNVTDKDGDTHTITRIMSYVKNEAELRLLNSHSLFAGERYYFTTIIDDKNVRLSAADEIVFLGDMELSSDYTLNLPCSLNFEYASVKTNGEFKINHTYGGHYNIVGNDNSLLNGDDSAGEIEIHTPYAYYTTDLNINISSSSITIGNAVEITNDALLYAKEFLPERIYDSISLPESYKWTGATISYAISETAEEGSQKESFSGGIISSGTGSIIYGAAVRGTEDKTFYVTITASMGDEVKTDTCELIVCGTGEQAFINEIKAEIYNGINPSQVREFDVYSVITNLYKNGGFTNTPVTMSIEDSSFDNTSVDKPQFFINNSNVNSWCAEPYVTKSITLNYVSSTLSCVINQVSYDEEGNEVLTTTQTIDNVKSLMVGFPTMPLGEDFEFVLQTENSAKSEFSATFAYPTERQIIYYLRSVSPAFITNKAYGYLNVSDTNMLRLGDKVISNNPLLSNFDFEIYSGTTQLQKDGAVSSNTSLTFYFNYDATNNTLEFKDGQLELVDMKLVYNGSIDGSEVKELFSLPIIKAQPGAGGSDTQFETNNPFDGLFRTTKNWLSQHEFTTIEENMYGAIEITHINEIELTNENIAAKKFEQTYTVDGKSYTVDLLKVITIVGDSENSITANDGNTYYKKIIINCDLDYVPIRNTTITVHCKSVLIEGLDAHQTITLKAQQSYEFSVDGLYKCGSNSEELKNAKKSPFVFSDNNFYKDTISIIENKDPVYITEVEGNKYLLSDSSYLGMGENDLVLDYSDITKDMVDVSYSNLDGLQYFANYIKGLNFNGIKLQDISVLKNYKPYNLSEISMNNCSLTDGILYDTNTQSYLFDLPVLSVDLGENSITKTDKLVSRRVNTLDLSSQKINGARCLSSIEGLADNVSLIMLDIHGNKISRFKPIKMIKTMENVYLYDNISDNTDTMGSKVIYGTNGQINTPVYVWMIKEYSTKIHNLLDNTSDYLVLESADETATNIITKEEEDGSIILNAFAVPKQIDSIVDIRELEKITTNGLSGGVTGGTFPPEIANYTFRFITGNEEKTCIQLRYNLNVTTSPIIGSDKKEYSYILAVKDMEGNILAYREFIITITCNMSYNSNEKGGCWE